MSISDRLILSAFDCAMALDSDAKSIALRTIVGAISKEHPEDARWIASQIKDPLPAFLAFYALYTSHGRESDRDKALDALMEFTKGPRSDDGPDPGDLMLALDFVGAVHAGEFSAARGLLMAISDPSLRAWERKWLFELTGDSQDMDLLRYAADNQDGNASLMEVSVVKLAAEVAGRDSLEFRRRRRRARLLHLIELNAPEVMILDTFGGLLDLGDFDFCRKHMPEFGVTVDDPQFALNAACGYAVLGEVDRAINLVESSEDSEKKVDVFLSICQNKDAKKP